MKKGFFQKNIEEMEAGLNESIDNEFAKISGMTEEEREAYYKLIDSFEPIDNMPGYNPHRAPHFTDGMTDENTSIYSDDIGAWETIAEHKKRGGKNYE